MYKHNEQMYVYRETAREYDRTSDESQLGVTCKNIMLFLDRFTAVGIENKFSVVKSFLLLL